MVAKYHDVSLSCITSAEAHRFLSHIENAKAENYPELKENNSILIITCKVEAKKIITRGLLGLADSRQGYFSLVKVP